MTLKASFLRSSESSLMNDVYAPTGYEGYRLDNNLCCFLKGRVVWGRIIPISSHLPRYLRGMFSMNDPVRGVHLLVLESLKLRGSQWSSGLQIELKNSDKTRYLYSENRIHCVAYSWVLRNTYSPICER